MINIIYLFLISVQFHMQTVNVMDFGAKGDGVTNDYQAFYLAVNKINSAQGGTLVIPKGIYLLDEYSDQHRNMDLVFKDLKSLTIQGNQSTISIKGDFHRTTTKTGKKHKFSSMRSMIPITIQNSRNIRIENLEINGNANQTTRDKGVVEAGGHLILIKESKNITLNNLNLHHATADGLYIAGKNMPTENIVATNVISTHNARQGLTLGSTKNVQFINCKFNETGNTEGKYGHHAPSAGLDIEPHNANQKVTNISFTDCEFKNNIGSEVVISHISTTDGVTFQHCNFEAPDDSTRKWDIIVNAKNVNFYDCEFNLKGGSIYPTWHKPGSSAGFYNCYIKSADAGILAVSKNEESSVIIENCTLEYTGQEPVQRFFPYIRMKNLVFKNNSVIIPFHKRKTKGVDGLIENIKHLENNRFIYSDSKTSPRISTKNSTIIN